MCQPISGENPNQPDEPGGAHKASQDDSPEGSSDDDHPQPLAISLNFQTADIHPPIEGWLDVQLLHLAQLAGVQQMQLSVVIVADEQMSQLHEQYMDITGTTDVLSFDLSDDPSSPEQIEGELILCIDEASRQAASREHETRLELLLYALHGMLHLMGFDDHDDDEYDRMHAREDELLIKAGFEALFARDEKKL
ncbi:MAG TPA: rRNA maturation RNase YbeY [Phycisphaerales bacterium]|nr:rRNA maturation RNase YbeY [Phycisphaerales bacterium]|tara:strand:+ start:506 stop:1087 length:582 start_codon:yes stop_codon:yes gene_type:complete